ncbi:type I-C CRISPR-associated protein Cas8c/Csd1, partial [Acinetobacter baumannii]
MMIVILDAATSGRLSVTYYRELSKDEYVESILRWHIDAAWPLKMYDKEKKKFVAYEGAPSFADIISCAYDVSDRSSK